MGLYERDDAQSWEHWKANNPVPASKTELPWAAKTAQEQEDHLRYMAGYYNTILMNGGYVGTEVTFGNPYVYVWNGATQKYGPREENMFSPDGSGITPGPYETPASAEVLVTQARASNAPGMGTTSPTSSTAPASVSAVPAPSMWQRFVSWVKSLFGSS